MSTDELLAEALRLTSGTRAAGPLIRKVTVQRFPYLIAFESTSSMCSSLAVAHAKRRPLYWLTRVNP